ncbi:hypothetical protein B566_EDAN010145 [Ephemera danica]|nr:hypothetical protein B566_EDAN010145 [Ephemera danica]
MFEKPINCAEVKQAIVKCLYDSDLPCSAQNIASHLLDELEEELEAAAAVAALPIAPGPVALPQPPESAAVGFDMAALLHAVGGAEIDSVTSLTLHLLSHDASLQRLGLSLPCLRELTLDGSQLPSLRHGKSQSSARSAVLAALSRRRLGSTIFTRVACGSQPRGYRYLDLCWSTTFAYPRPQLPCLKLRELSLLGSPAALIGNGYRVEVRRQLPGLHLLDGHALPSPAAPAVQAEESDGEEVEVEVQPVAEQNQRRVRPASASATPSTRRELNARRSFHAESTGAAGNEVPSSLTSGGVVCGSLATALRRLRPHQCWTTAVSAEGQGEAAGTPPPDELLDAARQWRNNYQRFRQENSGRWSDDEDEDLAAPREE